VAGLKGVGAKVVLLEEASRLEPAVFSEVIVPLLGVTGTSLLAISTPLSDDSNFFNELLTMTKPNGRPFFQQFRIELMCEMCRTANKTDCPHMTHLLPSWKSSERQELVKTMMGSSALFAQEALGIPMMKQANALGARDVDAFLARRRDIGNTSGGCVFIALDPAGGGKNETAIVSLWWDRARDDLTLISSDGLACEDDGALEAFIFGHATRLLSAVGARRYVLCVEKNFGGSVLVSRICDLFTQIIANLEILASANSAKHVTAGVTTTTQVKERGRVELQRMLLRGSISVYSGFVSASRSALENLSKQLKSLRYEMKQRTTPFSKTGKTVLSGKGASMSTNDDLAIALLLACAWHLAVVVEQPGIHVVPHRRG
jgi:hypothetical protein